MKKINIKILEALKNDDLNFLLSDLDSNLKIGDLKNIIVSSMIGMGGIYNSENGEVGELEDWQKDDVKNWYFKDWIKFEINKHNGL